MPATHTRFGRKPAVSFRASVSAITIAAFGLGLSAAPARADGGDGVGAGAGQGGVDGTPASAAGQNAANGATAGGGGGGVDLTTGNGAAGGSGGSASTFGSPNGVPGATGGAGQVISTSGTISTSVSGGTGATGPSASGIVRGGGGGGGGVGVSATANITVTASGSVAGGSGGIAGTNSVGGGGGGGVGVFSSANVTIEAGGSVTGGTGGRGLSQGGGGGGAAAIVLTGGGTIENSGNLLGGTGGRTLLGSAGDGGAGVLLLSGGTIINRTGATIVGGTGGQASTAGNGGAGIKGANIAVINAGTISGGAVGVGSGTPTAGTAIEFTGGVNSLEIQAGSTIAGNVVAFSTADTFKLGGDTNASLDVSQIGAGAKYDGFGSYEKTGASTWTLTGTTATVTPWTLDSGILQISSDSNLGDPTGGLTFNGGTLQTTADITSARTVTLTGSGTVLTDLGTTLTLSNAISGASSLTKAGDGTMVLTGTNTYLGGTTIAAGTLQLGNGGISGSIVGNVLDNGTLVFSRSDASTFGGAISGTGAITQIGTGTTILTGENTYAGGTTIAAGVLVGSATSFGSGAILDNAALVIDQTSNASFANAINGSGTFTKQGAGRLNYTGTGSLSGPTTIAGGTLAVNGALAASAMTVLNGASLAGGGTVGATTVQSGGTVAPGNSIGTLTVNGAYVQAAGAVYQVEVDPTSSASDRIAVNGAATLAAGAVLNVIKTTNVPYVLGTTYTVLTTTNGLTGTFGLTGATDVTAFLGLVGTYDADNAYLQVQQMRTFRSLGQTSNQIATGGGLDGLPIGPLTTTLLNLLSDGAARDAFDQLSGEIHASAKTAMVEDSHFVRDAAINRVRGSLCAGSASGDASPDAYKASATDCADGSDHLAMWGQAFGSWGHTDGNGNAARLNRSIGGFFVGADVPVFETWRVGVLGGYSRSTFDVNGRNSSGDGDEYHVGLYAGTQMGAIGFRAGVTYTWHDVSISRSVAFLGLSNQLTGDYNAGTTQIFGELGYKIDAGQFTLEPFANLAYVNLHTDRFTESGDAAALTGDGDDTETTFTTLGLRPSIAFLLGDIAATLRGSLGWRHAFGDVAPNTTLSFAGGNPFEIAGVPIARDAALVDLGLDFDVASNVALGVSYGGQLAQGATDHSVRGTFTLTF